MHRPRLFSFLYLLQMQKAFSESSSPLVGIYFVFCFKLQLSCGLCALPTVDMHGLFLRKKKHENKLLTLLSRFVKFKKV